MYLKWNTKFMNQKGNTIIQVLVIAIAILTVCIFFIILLGGHESNTSGQTNLTTGAYDF